MCGPGTRPRTKLGLAALEVSAQREPLSDRLDRTRPLGCRPGYRRDLGGAERSNSRPLRAHPLERQALSLGSLCWGGRPGPTARMTGSEPGLYSSLDPSFLHAAHPSCSPWDSGGEDRLPRAAASCPCPTLTRLPALGMPG